MSPRLALTSAAAILVAATTLYFWAKSPGTPDDPRTISGSEALAQDRETAALEDTAEHTAVRIPVAAERSGNAAPHGPVVLLRVQNGDSDWPNIF